jgi:hypothetical protein
LDANREAHEWILKTLIFSLALFTGRIIVVGLINQLPIT